MAQKRMLVKSISVSRKFNDLTEFAQLAYLMIIPHLDDFGKMDGDPLVVRALVMPLSQRTTKDIEDAVKEMVEVGLIEAYEVGNQKVIRCITFEEEQSGLHKRTASHYPNIDGSYSGKLQEVPGNTLPTEQNRIEIEPKRTELNNEDIASKNFSLARELQKRIEPNNHKSLSLYLSLTSKIPHNLLYEWASEVEQSPDVRDKAKLFNFKAQAYLRVRKPIEAI